MDRYWSTTPRDYLRYLEVYNKLEETRAREMDYNNFSLGKYIAYAVNDPKKYPKKPFLWEEENKGKVMTGEEMDRIMKKNTIILGGTINGSS